ncbi:MAG: hypothetical protein H7288_21880 [Kineosporiaceae bacterium]|nr:hypothetical protein [Aeromicrobium sp.]
MRVTAIYEELRSRKKLRLERFPVSAILAAQLTLTIVLPAYLKGTQPFSLMLAICVVAVAGAFYVECVTLGWNARPRRPVQTSVGAANVVLLTGAAASLGAALGGQGSYAVQIGRAQVSPIVALLAPFTAWLLFGAALYMWLYREGVVSRRRALATLAAASAIQLIIGIERAILGQAVALVASLMVMAIFARLIRFRTLVILLLLLPILWPPIYQYRNTLREELAGSSVYVGLDGPMDRLQMDEQMAVVERLVPKPDYLVAPSLTTLIRTGLIPSAIDPNRPAIDTGAKMNQALGGTALSSTSATMMGNVYIFSGLLAVGAVSAALALGMRIALRRSSPWALSATGLIYLNGMSSNAAYPDIVPRLLQGGASLLIAFVLVRAVDRGRAEHDRS